MSYMFISIDIIKSFQKNPEPFNLKVFIEILKYINMETYGKYIEKIENVL